jgi:uncharacterized protein YndB with AHSA1/START domain
MRASDRKLVRKHDVYREVLVPERLVFTYATDDIAGDQGPKTLVIVTFTEFGGKTKLTLHQAVFDTIAARIDHHRGWTGALERLAEHLSGHPV